MANRTYWLDLFTGTTWREFLGAGGEISGFRERHWAAVQKLKRGDYLLCYLTGVSRWIAVLEVASEAFRSEEKIWEFDVFPCRVGVRTVVALEPETAVPILSLRDRLSFFRDLKSPNAWTGRVRSSLAKLSVEDGEAVLAALVEAHRSPVSRPVDLSKLERRPRALKSKAGSVTVPEPEPEAGDATIEVEPAAVSAHAETQWLLLRLGNDMGLDVWVARNDKNRVVHGVRFDSLPKMRQTLPVQFDEATNRTIELIDVLWLSGNAIVAAFEIESTTSIYSGLLRMSDLITMQPNLAIPLFLVAPDDRREKVIAEINRPTFARLKPPMSEMCRYIPFSALKRRLKEVEGFVPYLKPEFLDEIAESCEIEEE
jgi:hypothetical protein